MLLFLLAYIFKNVVKLNCRERKPCVPTLKGLKIFFRRTSFKSSIGGNLMKNKFFTSRNVATFGILTALVIVLQLFGSSIPMFGITLNFSLIPIALAGILLGWAGGAIVGFITTAVLGQEPITASLFQTNPAILTIMCIGKTTIAGLISGVLYKLISKRNNAVAVGVGAIAIPLINTSIYVIGMLLMKNSLISLMEWDFTSTWAVFATIFSIIWLNFVLEIVITIIFTPIVYKVIGVLGKYRRK